MFAATVSLKLLESVYLMDCRMMGVFFCGNWNSNNFQRMYSSQGVNESNNEPSLCVIILFSCCRSSRLYLLAHVCAGQLVSTAPRGAYTHAITAGHAAPTDGISLGAQWPVPGSPSGSNCELYSRCLWCLCCQPRQLGASGSVVTMLRTMWRQSLNYTYALIYNIALSMKTLQ